ncbi:MAG: BREX system Lon protease-like protein BrxL, partial [Acidimicrobiales bacterium]
TAFHDRIHAYLPGWDVPKLDPSHFTSHFGLVSDFLAECWSQLRRTSRLDVVQSRLEWGAQLSGRDRKAANNTVNGLLKLCWPDPSMVVPDDALAWCAELALELRRRVKEAQASVGADEFGQLDLSYRVGERPEKVVYCAESGGHGLRSASPAAPSSGAPAPSRAVDYAIGDVIKGRFEVLSMLGQGGFSKVYRVRDTVEDTERALKVFECAGADEAVRREIKALRKVEHPHVVKVYWADQMEGGSWYLVTEFVEGELLATFTTGKRRMGDRVALVVMLDVLDALVAIHPDSVRLGELDQKKAEGELTEAEYHELMALAEAGLVHRDIKPSNIIITDKGAKLLDFNIASRAGDAVHTQSGTPPYQPPDANLTRWDVSTDLFAVGVVLYELLCEGNHPYPSSWQSPCDQVVAPRVWRPDLEPSLAEFLVKACAPSRVDRFETAREMKEALAAIASEKVRT